MIPRYACLLMLVTVLTPSLAFAHAGDDHIHADLLQGALHPITGIDHLLAMLAVGWWAAASSAKRWWITPMAFAMATLVGAVIGALTSVALPAVEWLVAGSVVVFGVLMLATVRLPVIAAVAVAAGFGAFHGLAHGVELGGSHGVGAWILGMAAGTLLLHVAGVAGGRLALRHAHWLTRGAGVVTAALGVAMLGGLL